MKLALAAALLAACGSDAAKQADCADAAVCGSACPASFTGNFEEATLGSANCARIIDGPDQTLAFAIGSTTLGTKVAVQIDLGAAPAPGKLSSETTATWYAVAAESIGDGGCVVSAGNNVVPTGSFTLSLTAVDAGSAHGTLDVLAYVHALESTDCGAGDTEMLEVILLKAAVFAVLGACGSSHASADAAVDAAPVCVAKLSGNFAETWTATDDSCAMFSGGVLSLTVMATAFDAPLAIAITLGGDAAGAYSSETIAKWDATATQTVTHNPCLYRAGGDVAPPGDFMLSLAAGDHGTLMLDMFIHAPPFTDCGPNPVETLDLTF